MSETLPPTPGPRRPSQRTWRDDISAEWSRFTSGFTRENVVSNLKTLAWVIPLTLLIWIYAEREQVNTEPNISVPFELTSSDPTRAIALKPPQDKNLIVELQGPQARLRDLINNLRGGQMPQGLKLEVPNYYEVNKEHAIPTLPLVRGQKIFSDYGVTVLSVQPARLEVSIDRLIDKEAKIVVPPGVKNVDATFDPPTVKLNGPQALLNRPSWPSGELTVYAEIPRSALETPGHHDVPDVVVSRPDDLKDDRITIIKPEHIRGSIEVRQSDKTHLYTSLPVTVDAPVGTSRKYDIIIDRPNVTNVTVVGPPDLIDAMQKPDFRPQPKARLFLSGDELTPGPHSKIVEYDLPKGVDVLPEDKTKKVEYKVVELPPTPAP